LALRPTMTLEKVKESQVVHVTVNDTSSLPRQRQVLTFLGGKYYCHVVTTSQRHRLVAF